MTSSLEAELAFQIKALGLPEPSTQFQFDPQRRWRADFCWIAERILVEVQGGIWVKSGHTSGRGIQRDYAKWNAATLAGWKMFLVTSEMIKDGEAIALIQTALAMSRA